MELSSEELLQVLCVTVSVTIKCGTLHTNMQDCICSVGSDFYDNLEVRQRCEDTIHTLFNIDCLKILGHGKYQLAMSWPAVVPLKKQNG